MPRLMPKKRTPTTETPRSATDGCKAAVEINQDDVPIRATLEPIVSVLRRMERPTQFHEPLRKESRRKIMGICVRVVTGDWELETGGLRSFSGRRSMAIFDL